MRFPEIRELAEKIPLGFFNSVCKMQGGGSDRYRLDVRIINDRSIISSAFFSHDAYIHVGHDGGRMLNLGVSLENGSVISSDSKLVTGLENLAVLPNDHSRNHGYSKFIPHGRLLEGIEEKSSFQIVQFNMAGRGLINDPDATYFAFLHCLRRYGGVIDEVTGFSEKKSRGW